MPRWLLIFVVEVLVLVSSEEYHLETCCSWQSSERVILSCDSASFIRLNRIEMFSHSNVSCPRRSPSSTCCPHRSSCSRRLTKYFTSHCDHRRSCSIEKTCWKIHQSCGKESHFAGQFFSIDYSCYRANGTVPFLIRLFPLPQQQSESEGDEQHRSLSSSPLVFVAIVLLFLSSMFCSYYLASWIGRRCCRKEEKKVLTKTLIYHYPYAEKPSVEQGDVRRVYPLRTPIPFTSAHLRPLINVSQNPRTGQIISRTLFTYS